MTNYLGSEKYIV